MIHVDDVGTRLAPDLGVAVTVRAVVHDSQLRDELAGILWLEGEIDVTRFARREGLADARFLLHPEVLGILSQHLHR